jgi:hypothetical protein
MNYQDCERILYNILSGKRFIEVDGKKILITSPDVDVVNEANYIYKETLEKITGSYSRDDLNKVLINRGLFSSKDLEFIDNFNINLKKLQKQLYYTREDLSRNDVIRDNLKTLRDEYNRVVELTSLFDNYTSEGVASFAKSIFIMSKTAFYRGKLLKYSKTLYNNIFSELYRQHITQTNIRYIARNPPWCNMWVGLKNNGKIFENGVSLSVEQQGLLMWTRIYDSLAECSEPPSKNVINDDDMFDGWMASREDGETKNVNNQHEEVFIIANSQEDVDRISNMNSLNAKNIKNNRLNHIYNNVEVKESDLPDVAQGLAIKAAQQEMASRRGK